ncbi:hypothetical protein DFJ63DRAFT_215156 [Scheffersomyces coipomensis]|uniref:uncharacterized protein n=1 Tax=Scheffersomyces coipomensis TaxID=1788519 RepID=UPI00315C94DF
MSDNVKNKEIRRKRAVSEVPSESLIPSHILDQASQRIFIISLFILIQSWKLYDIILLKSNLSVDVGPTIGSLSNFSLVLKYAIIDGLFLWILPIFNIPYLSFSPFITLIFTILLNGFTLFLVSDLGVLLISTFILPVWNAISRDSELTIVGDRIDTNRVIDLDSHFKGRLTINYLPDSSAKMNPFHLDKICLDKGTHTIDIPIEFNTTTNIGLIQIQHTNPKNEIKYINYTGNSLSKLLKKDLTHLTQYKDYKNSDNIFYLEFPIHEAGLYKIKQVTDAKNINIRTYKSELLIPNCPSAQFFYPKLYDQEKNYQCISKKSSDLRIQVPLVEYHGVTPGNLKLVSRINGKPYKNFNLSIGEKYSEFNNKDLSWLNSVSLIRNSLEQELLKDKSIINNAGEGILEFQLIQASDSLGHTKRYNPESKDRDVWFDFTLRKASVFGIQDRNPHAELIIGSKKVLHFTGIESLKESDFPVTISVSYNNKNNNILSADISKTFSKLQDLASGIEVDKEGTYQLVNASTRFCEAEIAQTNTVTLKLAQPPNVEINATPLVDKCLGTTGYEFTFDLVGKPPFYIQYQVYQNQSNGILRPVHNERGSTVRVIETMNPKHDFKFRPPQEGNYVVVFNNLKDTNYRQHPVTLEKSYSTYFQKVSKVSLGGSRDYKTCFGDSVKIPLKFEGNGPFSFNYDIVDVQSRQKLIPTVEIKDVNAYEIAIPESLSGKSYEIKLIKAEDKFSCPATVDRNERVVVHSRASVPHIQIDKSAESYVIVEGDHVDIPLVLQSSAASRNDKLEFKVVQDGKVKKKVTSITKSLYADEAGVYSLVSFINDGCPGVVSALEKTVTISYHNKPNLTMHSDNVLKQHSDESTLHLASVCKGCKNPLKLKLEGVKPFVVDYEIKLPSGKIEAGSMNVENNEVIINLPTREVGRYEHTFIGVYDNLYTKHKSGSRKQKRQVVLYDTNPLPQVKFDEDNRSVQVCENKLNQLEKATAKIPIITSGQYPFTVNAVLKHEQTGREENIVFKDVQEPFLHIYGSGDSFGLGEHVLTINSVVDGNGCKSEGQLSSNYFVIVITELPSINHAAIEKVVKRDYCVGDHISYELTGVPPFTVFYNFNDRQQKANVDHHFSRLASKPGILSIDSVQDSSATKCVANFTGTAKGEDLKLIVHELPSVEVNKGDHIIEDLHEGDQTEIIFTFIGVPPFRLTYVRKVDTEVSRGKKVTSSDNTKQKVVEKHVLEDINDYEVIIKASLEGTYEAIEVQDAFCTAKRHNY